MMVKKKRQSRSQSSTEKKTLEPKLPSISHSKSASSKDFKHMIRGMSSKHEQGLSSSQSRVVRCPKCHKFLQEPVDVTIYKCSGCNSILQAKPLELKNNDNSIHQEDLFSSKHRSLTPVRSLYRKYSSRTSPSVETTYRRHETSSYIRREWIRRRGDEFNVTGDFASARSCSGVVKLSITKKEDTTLSDLLRFVDSGTSFAEKTVRHSHLSCSDKSAGDRTDAVNMEEFEDKKGNKERDTRRSISSDYYDLKLEAFQPSVNHKLREQQQKAASRIHLEEESAEGSNTPVRSSYRKYSSRPSPSFEKRHETSSYIRREWMTRSASPSPSSYGYTSPFQWSQEFSSSAAASPIRFQGETSDQKYYHHWSSQKSQMHDDSQLSIITKKEDETLLAEETVVIHQHEDDSASEKDSGDRVDAVMWETFEDKGIKEEKIRSISSKFIDLTFQPQWNHKLSAAQASQEILSIETETVADRLIISHSVEEPLNKKEHVCEAKNTTRDTQEFDLGEVKWEDILGNKRDSICDRSSISSKFYDLKLEAFQPWLSHKEDTNSLLAKESFIGNSDQSGEKATDEYENISDNRVMYDLEETNEEALETMEDRAGLHLEEYETNYESYRNPFEWSSEGLAPTFHIHEYESTTLEETFGLSESTTPMFCLPEPDNEAADGGSSESSSTGGSFNSSHESSKLRAVFHQEEEEEEPQVMMSESRTEVISVKLEDIFEWTSQRAPTFRLYDEPELGELLKPDEEAYETKAALKVDVMAGKDGPSLDWEKFENEKLLVEDQRVEPREDIFRLSVDDTVVEQEWVKFHSSPDMQVNLTQKENEKSRLTSEVVGLRHALYQTQTSPLSSPIFTPIGSPKHILMRSPMSSHIVSPLRSPTNSSGSLSDVLFFGKKT